MKSFLINNKWLCLSGIGLSTFIGLACGDYGFGIYTSNFTPEIFVSNSLSPLNYDASSKFYQGTSYYNSGLNNQDSNNSDKLDWHNYTNKNLSVSTIEKTMYSNTEDRDLELKKLLKNTNKQVRNFAVFATLANKIDYYANTTPDPWDYKPAPLMNATLAKDAEVKYNETTDSFLKNRYWYLTLKAYFYSKDKSQVIRFFNQTQANHTQHKYYSNAVDYVGGAYYAQKDFINSNLAFAEAFTLNEDNVMPNTNDFKVLSNADFDKMLAQAKSVKIKTAIWTIMAYKKSDVQALNEVYKLDPNSPYLNLLLTRAININESSFVDFYEKEIEKNDNNAYLKRASKAVNSDLYNLVKNVATKNASTQNQDIWQLAFGYLSMYKGDYKTADHQFQMVSKTAKTSLLKDQIRLFKFLNTVLQTSKLSSDADASFITEYNWLMFSKLDPDTYYKDYDTQKIRIESAQQFVNQYLSNIYVKNKQTLMAQMLKPNSNYFNSDKNLADADSFFSKQKFTNWELALMRLYNVKADDVYNQLAYKAIIADDLEKAQQYLNKVKIVSSTIYNPFNGLIKDRAINESKRELSYKKVVEMMQEMKKNIASKTDVYNNALLLANAYYNLGYFGNNREVYYNQVFYEMDSSYPSPVTYKYSNQTAKKYYNLALENAENDEQKAKITYLLTKIERNEFYTKTYFLNSDYYGYTENMFKKFDGYKTLKTKYSHTKYYKEVINECGYFKKYLNLG